MSTVEPDRDISYIRAVNLALRDALESSSDVILFGEDVAVPNGPFGASKGLHAEFGDRVFDTPISESAMVGAALGAAIGGLRPVVEVMYGDFLLVAMDQIVNQVANTRYVSEGRMTAPLVIRTQHGHTPGACAQHSQSLEAMFAHVPGLRIAIPATPQDAYSMLRAAVMLDDPVMVFESRRLYPTKGPVRRAGGDVVHEGRVGEAQVVSPGSDVTVVTWGTGRQIAEDAVAALPGASVELIDLRWLSPWDRDTVVESVRHTGRLLVVHEASQTAGFGAEVVSAVAETVGSGLRAVRRVGLLDSPVPASPALAQELLPTVERVIRAVTSLLEV